MSSASPVFANGKNMHRFWIKFDVRFGGQTYGVLLGCGVTANNFDEAMKMCETVVFRGSPVPRVLSVIEDVDLASLDQKHVIPNIADPGRPGVWFPGYNADPLPLAFGVRPGGNWLQRLWPGGDGRKR